MLARGAIENLATALWILGPNQRAVRIERTLRWHVKNATDQLSATERFEPSKRTLDDRLQDLERLVLNAPGAVPAKFRNGPPPGLGLGRGVHHDDIGANHAAIVYEISYVQGVETVVIVHAMRAREKFLR